MEQHDTKSTGSYQPQRFKDSPPEHEIRDASGYHAKHYQRKKRSTPAQPAQLPNDPGRSANNPEQKQHAPQRSANRPAQKQNASQHSAKAPAQRQNAPKRSANRPAHRQNAPQRPVNHPARKQNAPRHTANPSAPSHRTTHRPPQGNAPASPRPQNAAPHTSRTQKTNEKKPFSGIPRRLWHLSLAGYAILLLIAFFAMKSHVRGYMEHYEASQPKYVMDSYVSTLGSSFYLDMLKDAASKLPVCEFESPEKLYALLSEQADTDGFFTYEESETATQEQPVYTVYKDGAAIADVTLSQSGTDSEYGFPFWAVQKAESRICVNANPEYTVHVMMPVNCTLYINDFAVPADRCAVTDSFLQLDETALLYSSQPQALECKIDGFYLPPDVRAVSADGIILETETTPESNSGILEYTFLPPNIADADPTLQTRTEALTKAYINYVINMNRDREHNIAVLNQYLLPNGQVQNLMYGIWSDIYWNNTYNTRDDKQLEVLNIRQYTDTCCVCEVAFETELSKVMVNNYVGKIRWTMIHNGNGWFASGLQLVS